MELLPLELIYDILKNLDFKSLRIEVPLVCKKFHEISSYPAFNLSVLRERWFILKCEIPNSNLKANLFFQSFLVYAVPNFVHDTRAGYCTYVKDRIHDFVDYCVCPSNQNPISPSDVCCNPKRAFMTETIAFIKSRSDLSSVEDIQIFLSFIPFEWLPFIVLTFPSMPILIKAALLKETNERATVRKEISKEQIKKVFISYFMAATDTDKKEILNNLIEKNCNSDFLALLEMIGKELEEEIAYEDTI